MKENEKIIQAAEIYRNLKSQIRELEKQAAPYKKILKEHAEAIGMESVDLGPIIIQKRTNYRTNVKNVDITPDWLRRIRKNGYDKVVTVVVDNKTTPAMNPPGLMEFLEEVGYSRIGTVSYAVRAQI